MRTRRTKEFSSGPMSSAVSQQETGHRTVLLQETVDALAIQESDTIIDATLGGAGHSREVAKRLGAQGTLVGFDMDPAAIARAREALAGSACAVHLIEANFRTIETELPNIGIESIDGALFDLGWSSYQLDAGRGFSFQKDEPLLMTYGTDAALNAGVIVNTWGEESLADIIFGWGEERYSRRIARAIVERRERDPFTTARDLAETIKAAVPPAYRFGRIHPATKTFQALRIAVNDELGALHEGITGAWHLLNPGGRIAVISFHSIEDREVKRLLVQLAAQGGSLVTKKPIPPSSEEIITNPRARSAKLRVIQKDHAA